jgi:hypothetical protein
MMTPPLIATAADVDVIVEGMGRALARYADQLARGGHLR